MDIHRRTVIKAGLGLGAAMLIPDGGLFAQAQPLIQKKIPSSGETIPIIGIGTARRYEEVKNDAEKVPLRETIRQFQALGGKVIDSSPSYGTAEAVVGELADGLKVRDSLFLATKVSLRNVGREEGIKQIEESFKKYRTNKIDLIAVHNLRDTDTQLRTLREMKQAGRIRYVGITTSFDNQYGEFEQVIKKEVLDFIQVDYALDNRDAGDRIIPLAGDRGAAVMINLPFGRGRLIQRPCKARNCRNGRANSIASLGRNSFSSTSSLIRRLPARFPAWRGPNTSSITSARRAAVCPMAPCGARWSSSLTMSEMAQLGA